MVVGIAAWLTRAGVVLGLLGAAAELAVVIVFSDQLAAAERAIEAEEQRFGGEPVGVPMVTAADFAMAWAIGAIVLASVAGVLAIVLVRASTRGSDPARIGLVVLSGLVAAWAICPVGPPSLILTDTPDAPLLGAGVLTLWLLQKGVTLTLAAAVVVLLLLPSASQYFRPKVIERPGLDASTGSTPNKDTAAMLPATQPSEPEPVPPPATTGQAIQLVRPRHVGIAIALVYVAVAIALLTAVAELVITIAFRENLLAAERAIAESMPPLSPPDGQADPTLIFSTDTAAFARGWATAAMIGTLFVALVAVVLARTMSRGSNRARVGLAVLSGITALLAICPFMWLPISLAAEPAAGTLLNVWPVVRMLEGLAVAGLAVAVLALPSERGGRRIQSSVAVKHGIDLPGSNDPPHHPPQPGTELNAVETQPKTRVGPAFVNRGYLRSRDPRLLDRTQITKQP
jgi:hypothetical protein